MSRRVVLGVTGSIAAYKALDILRRLQDRGAVVSVVLTSSARELVTPLSFESLAGGRVYTGLFAPRRPAPVPDWQLEHIELARSADLILIAPASANILGKVASGIADDLLSTVVMAASAPVVFAPAMNDRMWLNPIVQQNVARLRGLGYRFVEPESGSLACGSAGTGRLAGVETIVEAALARLDGSDLLAGRTVLVSTGRTEEPIDPVRVISNRSSGRMGFSLARAARNAGARVIVVAGRTSVPAAAGIPVESVTTTAEMLAALQRHLPAADILFMAAAPADFRPAAAARRKLKDRTVRLDLERTPDILAELGRSRPRAVMVGFALETDNLLANARAKLRAKQLDLIVANPATTADSESIQATLVTGAGRSMRLKPMAKTDFAARLVAEAARLLKARSRRISEA